MDSLDEQLRGAIWRVFRDNSPDSAGPHALDDEPTWVHVLVSSFAAAAKGVIAPAHDARVTELLTANNREVERRRAAESKLRLLSKMAETSILVAEGSAILVSEAELPMGPLQIRGDFRRFGEALTACIAEAEARFATEAAHG